jgi:hypothetical protein
MRPDPGRDIQVAILTAMDPEARQRERTRLSERERLLAWTQADAAGPRNEMERAESLLKRLHPEMSEASLRQIMDQLADAASTGAWHGFKRPAPID